MRAACIARPAALTAGSRKAERSCRCQFFMLTACGLPLRSQVLHTADAVINMLDLMPPLRGEHEVRVRTTHSTRGALALAPDT